MACCAVSTPTNSQSVPASATRTAAQNDFSLLALALLTSMAPVAETRPQISLVPSPLNSADAPLLERLCVRLI
jgi:hypothetical protein